MGSVCELGWDGAREIKDIGSVCELGWVSVLKWKTQAPLVSWALLAYEQLRI